MKALSVYLLGICGILWICNASALKECQRVPAEYVEVCRARVRHYYDLKQRFHQECCAEELKINADSDCEECDSLASDKAAEALEKEKTKPKTKTDETDDSPKVPVLIEDRISLGGNRANWARFQNNRVRPTPPKK